MKPIRIQLRRTKGFNLQAHSLALNGLSAVNVARPSRYGNPHHIGFCPTCGEVHSRISAVNTFRAMMERSGAFGEKLAESLRGKNLACWCKLSEPCHADYLLALANPPCMSFAVSRSF